MVDENSHPLAAWGISQDHPKFNLSLKETLYLLLATSVVYVLSSLAIIRIEKRELKEYSDRTNFLQKKNIMKLWPFF